MIKLMLHISQRRKTISIVAHARSSSPLADKIKNEIVNADWNKQDFYI